MLLHLLLVIFCHLYHQHLHHSPPSPSSPPSSSFSWSQRCWVVFSCRTLTAPVGETTLLNTSLFLSSRTFVVYCWWHLFPDLAKAATQCGQLLYLACVRLLHCTWCVQLLQWSLQAKDMKAVQRRTDLNSRKSSGVIVSRMSIWSTSSCRWGQCEHQQTTDKNINMAVYKL